MSIINSYFSKNNTLISNSFTNTGRNPVMELFYGNVATTQYPNNYSRFIFDLDLTLLKQLIFAIEVVIHQSRYQTNVKKQKSLPLLQLLP